MKISLAQINPHIGNFRENTRKIIEYVRKAEAEGSELVVFPGLAVCGYPPLDLLERREFIDKCRKELETIAHATRKVSVLIGAPTHNEAPAGKNLFNSAYFLSEGKIQDVFHKTLLPTYDIFDEYRYFEPNRDFRPLIYKGLRLAITICEDLWDDQPVEQVFGKNRLYPVSPMEKLAASHPRLIINMAASPFSYRKIRVKKEIFTNKAKQYRIPVLSVNQVGAQTELIFEGASLVVNSRGEVVHEMDVFREDCYQIDTESIDRMKAVSFSSETDPIPFIYEGLVLGIRDYFSKNGLNKAILGLSGGIDSAVTLGIAAEALGRENLHVLMLPTRFSSGHSISDAKKLAENLEIRYDIFPIEGLFSLSEQLLSPLFNNISGGIRT